MELSDNNKCFGCGTDNPIGLKLSFSYNPDEGTASATTILSNHFQGWEGIAHGGIITTLLDEALAHAAFSRKIPCVTGELTVRFKKPVPLGTQIVVRGKIVEDRNPLLYATATVEHNGVVLAEATGKMVVVRES